MIVSLFDRAFKLMKKVPIKGDFVEFGTYQGGSLIQTIKMAKRYLKGEKMNFYGFDSFKGMPKTKKKLTGDLASDWGEGTFADTSLELVEKKLEAEGLEAKLIKGNFGELKPLSKYGIKKIRFAHIDADIYEGYRDALSLIEPHIQVGTVIIFDEFIPPSDARYQGIRFQSQKAIREWEEKSGLNLHLIRFKWSCGICVIVDEKYLKKYGRYIEKLRNDNRVQSLFDILHQFSFRLNI